MPRPLFTFEKDKIKYTLVATYILRQYFIVGTNDGTSIRTPVCWETKCLGVRAVDCTKNITISFNQLSRTATE